MQSCALHKIDTHTTHTQHGRIRILGLPETALADNNSLLRMTVEMFILHCIVAVIAIFPIFNCILPLSDVAKLGVNRLLLCTDDGDKMK